jgi:hypothetical protein
MASKRAIASWNSRSRGVSPGAGRQDASAAWSMLPSSASSARHGSASCPASSAMDVPAAEAARARVAPPRPCAAKAADQAAMAAE